MSSPHSVSTRHARFNLLDLASSMAIMAILAALAMPYLHDASMKANATELEASIDGVTHAFAGFLTVSDEFSNFDSSWYPSSTPSKDLQSWPSSTAFDQVGWAPEGAVRAVYKYQLGVPDRATFLIRSDMDGDATWWRWAHVTFDSLATDVWYERCSATPCYRFSDHTYYAPCDCW